MRVHILITRLNSRLIKESESHVIVRLFLLDFLLLLGLGGGSRCSGGSNGGSSSELGWVSKHFLELVLVVFSLMLGKRKR
jgi:hypothetical protein